jgi:hypothetical protein
MVGVGADEQSTPAIIEDDLIEINTRRIAQTTRRIESVDLEGIVVEVEARDLGMRRYGVDAFRPTRTEQVQGG